MANMSGSSNQPSHDTQVKGGQQSHSGGSSTTSKPGNQSNPNQGNQGGSSGGNR